MLNSIRKIEGHLSFEKKFSFCTLVTRFDEYIEMVESAQLAGFVGDDVEFLYFDNKNSNQFDGYSGVNRAIKEAKGQYLIFCHQDILFQFDTRQDLEHRIAELEQLDPYWAVLGNAGKTLHEVLKIRISDPHGANQHRGELPAEVLSLDENFLIINQLQNFECSANLSGFHLYATDLCQNALSFGLKSYVIDFHLLHKSPGKLDQSYFMAQKEYMDLLYQRKQKQFIWTVCSSFFISSSKILNFLFNQRRMLRWARKRFKKRS